jgi:hypothetical protein
MEAGCTRNVDPEKVRLAAEEDYEQSGWLPLFTSVRGIDILRSPF